MINLTENPPKTDGCGSLPLATGYAPSVRIHDAYKYKGCPFCGRVPEVSFRASKWNITGEAHFVVCYCGGHGARAHIMSDTEADARTKWNTRHA
jgi:hypothetical protein